MSGDLYSTSRAELLPYVPRSVRRVLDVGCGGGGFGAALLKERPDLEVVGVEPDAPLAARASAGGYSRVLVGRFPDVSFQLQRRDFDLVCFNDVLEHLPDPEPALRAALQFLVPATGSIMISVPNARNYRLWWPLVRHGAFDYTASGLLDRTHLRWFTRSSLASMVQRCGLAVVELQGINAGDGWRTRGLNRLSGNRAEDFLHMQFVVIARELPT